MNKPTVILLSGKSESGKDFTANILKEKLEALDKSVLLTHYADLLKYVCKTFFDWDGQKDERGRTLLQHVGTDVIREKSPDLWVRFIRDIIESFPNEWDYILIPDTRFHNEISVMKDSEVFDVFTIRVVRPNYVSTLTEEQKKHPSETALDFYGYFNYCINNKSKEIVEAQIDDFIKKYLKLEKKPTTIYIDMDGTLYNTIKAILDLYDQDFKYYSKYRKIDWETIITWDFTELKAATPEYINHYFNQQRFFDIVEMFKDAKDVITELKSRYGYNITFVSLGYKPNLLLKQEYIKANFPDCEFIGVDMKEHKDKSHIDMSGNKGNIFIDDRADNLETSNAPIKICFGECYDWNKDWLINKKDKFDAFKWDEVRFIINNLNNSLNKEYK